MRRLRTWYGVGLLLVVLAAAGCGTLSRSGTETEAQATSAAWATAQAPTEVGATQQPGAPQTTIETVGETEALPAGAALVYQRTGGIAGLQERWTLYDDGRLTAHDGGTAQVAPERVGALLAAAKAAGFFQMQARYGKNLCCDRFAYALTVRDGAQQHTVQWFEGAEANVPPQLLALAAQFLALAAK